MIFNQRIKIVGLIFSTSMSLLLSGCGGSSSNNDDETVSSLPDCTIGVSEFSGCWANGCKITTLNGIDHSALSAIRYKETNSNQPTSGIKESYSALYDTTDCSGTPIEVSNLFSEFVIRNYTTKDKEACLETGGTLLSGGCEKIDIEHLINGVKNELFSVSSSFYVINQNLLCLPVGKTTDDNGSSADPIDLTLSECYVRFTF